MAPALLAAKISQANSITCVRKLRLKQLQSEYLKARYKIRGK